MKTWLENRRKRKHCPHQHLLGIYGDQILFFGGYRLYCRDCRQLLDGPVTLADERR